MSRIGADDQPCSRTMLEYAQCPFVFPAPAILQLVPHLHVCHHLDDCCRVNAESIVDAIASAHLHRIAVDTTKLSDGSSDHLSRLKQRRLGDGPVTGGSLTDEFTH